MGERTTPGNAVALSIAGSDPSGGAGIQADLKTFSALKTYGCAVITAVTVQNTQGVKHRHMLEAELVDQQISAVVSDINIQATKTGLLGNASVITAVAEAVKRQHMAPLVVDPVMVSKTGDSLIDDSAVGVLCDRLIPLATVVTPNVFEAARLVGINDPISDVSSASSVAVQICKQLGPKACVVTGITRAGDGEDEAVDVFFDGNEVLELAGSRRQTENLHGAGCTFSAAITAALARGETIGEAVVTAKAVVGEAIRQTTDLGQGTSPVNHLAYLDVKS